MPTSNKTAPLIERLYARFLSNERSADFVQDVAGHYSITSLERLAIQGSPAARRGAALAISFMGDYSSNPVLGKCLRDRDRGVRLLADHGIRQLWMRVGNPHTESSLRQISRLLNRERNIEAIDLASDVIDQSPETAEAWNLRALAWSNIDEHSCSVDDSRKVLELNPWHFYAAMSAANSHLELGNVVEAIRGFHLALDINPDLEVVRGQVRRLKKMLDGR